MDGDGGEGHNSSDEGKRETAQRGNDDERHKGVWGAQMWRGTMTEDSPHLTTTSLRLTFHASSFYFSFLLSVTGWYLI